VSGERRSPSFAFWIIVVFVFIVLILIAVPNYLSSGHHGGQYTACQSNCKNIGTALEMYSTDNAGFYPPNLSMLTSNYLKTIPTCPAAGAETYSRGYQAYNNEVTHEYRYAFCCSGNNHQYTTYKDYFLYVIPVRKKYYLGIPADYPQYDSTNGLTAKP
jgi:competence protein ComGC